MIEFTYNNWNIKILDQRPKSPYIQVNVYNPNDNGHALTNIFHLNNFNSTEDIEEIKNEILESKIDALLEQAEQYFNSTN